MEESSLNQDVGKSPANLEYGDAQKCCRSTFPLHPPWTQQEPSLKPHSWRQIQLVGKGKLKSHCKPALQDWAPGKVIPAAGVQEARRDPLCHGQQDSSTVPAKGSCLSIGWAQSQMVSLPALGSQPCPRGNLDAGQGREGANVLLLLKTSCCFPFEVSGSLDLIKFEEGNEE